MKASYCKYILKFKQPAGTSRGILTEKETYFLKLEDEEMPGVVGIGECALFRGLSFDDKPEYEEKLGVLCQRINNNEPSDLSDYPSMMFGLETAINDFVNGGKHNPFPSEFTEGKSSIPINGLVWMGNFEEMKERIDEKIKAGFTTIKLKVGAIDFESELNLVKYIRCVFPPEVLTIRLDANGGFTPENALSKLEEFAKYGIHSIEQPIKAGQWKEMQRICKDSPINIALDEELIGIIDSKEKAEMLEEIKPDFIILKPSLIGGFSGAESWMQIASMKGVGGWITSALESNVGLNAIAQWTAKMGAEMPQGLGTGALFTNNIDSPLEQKGDSLYFNANKSWRFPKFDWK